LWEEKKMVIIAYRAYGGGLEHSSDFALQANHCTYHLMHSKMYPTIAVVQKPAVM